MNNIDANTFNSGLAFVFTLLFGVFFFAAIVFFGWVLPIMLGIKQARKKNYSPAWMWVGIHPLFGWMAFIVLVCVRPKVQCASCGGFVTDNFIKCPFCHDAVKPSLPPPL